MERLQKVLAAAGVASRRKAEQLILEGRVKVNGNVVKELGTKVSETDVIAVDGKKIKKEEKVYYVMNKPRNTLCTVTDDRGRPTVMDYFKEETNRIYPVGRLDFDTTGCLILTNDGELTEFLTHPKGRVEKVYIATVKGEITQEEIEKLEAGLQLEDGKTQPARAKIQKYNKEKDFSVVQLAIKEGKNHQVKRMFEAINYEVVKLSRESVGCVNCKGLKFGEFRKLTPREVTMLKNN